MTDAAFSLRPGDGAGDPAIRVDGLCKAYDTVRAVWELGFEVRRGGITGLLGGNGAGKTTTLAMLLGLVTPTAGAIEVLGVDMVRDRYAALPRMNFSSPYVDLPHRLTVQQNLLVYARLYGVPDARQRLAELLENLDLEALAGRPVGKLSAGQKTRVALAKSLVNRPAVLLLDEPTASLDPDTGDWVRGYLEHYCETEGATILLASHNMAEVERMADDVIMMRAGRMVDQGPPRALIERYGRANMEEVFLDIARAEDTGAAPDRATRAAR
jgi:ABC-2 type transport system ATP-binding protein